VFILGWRVLLARIGTVVDAARVHRAAWIAVACSVVVLVGAVALQLAFGWAGTGPARPVVVIALVSLGLGSIVFSCFPTDRPLDPAATINGRQVRPDWQMSVRGSVQPYLGRQQRPVAPEDREAVLTDVRLLQRGLIRRLTRLTPLLGGIALLGVAAFVGSDLRPIGLLWAALYVCALPELVVRLGRSERARLAALSADPPAGDADTAKHGVDGSKVRLSDD
jgi:hypothetical protein